MLNIELSNILFIDIETVPQYPFLSEMPDNLKKHWERKAKQISVYNPELDIEKDSETIYQKAGIYAEFGKIVCISAGFINGNTVRVKSFYSDDESLLLEEFTELLNKHYASPKCVLCGHNAKEFDIPFICRRLLINSIKLPAILDISCKKPWEIPHIDTMQLWKFGDMKNYTSLELLTSIFNIPSPKDDIQGSDVAEIYWKNKDLERIAKYCQKDVVAVIQLYLKLNGLNLIKDEYISYN